MLLLPYDEIQITSRHPAKIALERLQKETDRTKGFYCADVQGKKFRCKVHLKYARIQGLFGREKYSLSVIKGEVLEDGSRSVIKITIRPDYDTLIVLLLVTILMLSMTAVNIYDTIHNGTGTIEAALDHAVFCVLFYAGILIFYKIEVMLAKKHLLRIFA